MGNSSSGGNGKSFKEMIQQYQDLGEQHDTRYGRCRLYQERARPETKVVAKTFEFASKVEYNQFFQRLKRREEVKSPHLCKVYGGFDSTDDTLCVSFYKLTLLYEHSPYDLEQDLLNRMRLPNNNPDKVDCIH